MKPLIILIISILYLLSCNQKDNFTPELHWVNYIVTSTDTLNFKTAGTPQYLAISIDSISGPSDTVSYLAICKKFSNINYKTSPDSLIFKKNATTNYGITHSNNFALQPGFEYCQLNISQLYVKNPKLFSKRIVLNMTPSCAFNFKTFSKSSLTSNGSTTNKPITCTYNESGNLVIELLLDTPLELVFDCDNKIINILPITYNGALYTGNGSYNNDSINLTVLRNNQNYATARIIN
jgi:hypothetical protein